MAHLNKNESSDRLCDKTETAACPARPLQAGGEGSCMKCIKTPLTSALFQSQGELSTLLILPSRSMVFTHTLGQIGRSQMGDLFKMWISRPHPQSRGRKCQGGAQKLPFEASTVILDSTPNLTIASGGARAHLENWL